MAEYIERESLKAEFMNHYASEYPAALVLAMIDNQPAANVAAVRHGKWDSNGEFHQCSVCTNFTSYAYDYCPYCGAKMDLE